MQRRAKTYATSLALALALSGSLTACSGSSGGGGGNDAKPGGTSATGEPAPPGKYRTLPEPCGAVSLNTLKSALPGAADSANRKSESQSNAAPKGPSATLSPYAGKPSLTYDTDRRVGCRWKSATSLGTRHLSVDMERVVSYDSSVSDDRQAQELYQKRAQASHIPDSASPSATEDSGSGSGSGKGDESGAGASEGPGKDQGKDGSKTGGKGTHAHGGSGSRNGNPGSAGEKPDSAASPSAASEQPDSASPSPGDDLSPRTLGNIGDNAYINDKLDTADSGEHRDITLVFRSANVIATVRYDQWLTDKRRVPDSAELQQAARRVAGELASDFG